MPMAVRLLTPSGVLYETDRAELLAAPGAAGNLHVEPGHINLMTTLAIGPLSVWAEGAGEPLRFAVHGGFLEATPKRVQVLADAAEPIEGIDVARAQAARRRAAQRLTRKGDPDVDVARAEAALKRAMLRLEMADATP